MDFDYFISLFISGSTRGSIYALLALGYTMVYGIVKLINFAHGEIYMIGAFIALIVASILAAEIALPLLAVFVIATVVAMVVSVGYGYTIEKIAYKPLRTSPRLSALISAVGMSLFLQNYVLLAQTSKFLPFPALIPKLKVFQESSFVSTSQMVIFSTTAVVMVVLWVLIKHTRMGKSMRATAQDKTMAQLVGININRVISFTFVVGSATAALGGVLISSHIGQINYYIGFIAGIKAFVAAVLGGIGSIPGAVLGSFVLGWTEAFGTGYISSDYEDVFAFLFLVLILIFRPEGLLGRSTKQKV